MKSKVVNENDKYFQVATKMSKEKRDTRQEREDSVRQLFKLFDKNNDGKIERSEIGEFLKSLGREATKEEIEELIKVTDKDNNGYITIDEFIDYIDSNYVLTSNQIDELVDAFKIFDIDKSGKITMKEFSNILTKYGNSNFSEKDIEDIFTFIDFDKDGEINYAEFIDMWKYQ